ncbi:MAG: PAS domain S-box protein [Cytophagales bacterium]|nr:PAS domain S-box protein [Cytophagales bacterium]
MAEWILVLIIFLLSVLIYIGITTYIKFNKLLTQSRNSELQLSLIFNYSTNYILLINSRLEIIKYNKSFAEAYKRLFKIEIKEGDLYLEYNTRENHEKMLERIKRVIAGETITHYRVANIDNKPVFLTIIYSPIANSQKVVDSILITIVDNTAQKIYEAKLLENSIKFKELANSSTVMLWSTDERDNVNFYNDALKKYMGVKDDEDLDKAWRDRMHPDFMQPLEEVSKHAIEKTISYTYTFKLRKADGTYGWIKEIGHPKFNLKGDFEGFTGSCVDITELKEAEVKLLEEKRFNQKLTELSPDIIYLYDITQKQNIYENKSILAHLGYHDVKHALHTDNLKFLIHPDDEAALNKYYGEMIYITEDEVKELHLRLRKPDGTYRWFVSKDILFARNDKHMPTQILGNLRDDTERIDNELAVIKANKELKKANEELDNFVYRASHDLKAPLTSIQGLADLLREENTDTHLTKYIDHIGMSTQRLMDVIQDLVNHSKNSRVGLQIKPIHFEGLIGEVVDTLMFMKNAEKISFVYHFDIKSTFCSDEFRIKVILNNLISNAIKYHDMSKSKPSVYIEVSQDENQNCTIVVQDNGMGIDGTYHDKIFDMFFRATKSGSGSGLGLYIVKEALHKIKGSINVKSTPEQGSTFEILLPNFINMEENILAEQL